MADGRVKQNSLDLLDEVFFGALPPRIVASVAGAGFTLLLYKALNVITNKFSPTLWILLYSLKGYP